MTPRTSVDTQVIADQERAIARLRAEVELLEQHDREFDELVSERFNPPDDDSSTAYSVIEGVAAFIEGLPCACTPAQIEDWDACPRCRVLGRIGDAHVAR